MATTPSPFDEAPHSSSSTSSGAGEYYKSTLREALNGSGRWDSGFKGTAAGDAQGQEWNSAKSKRARRTAVAAATISGGSGGIGGVAGGKSSGGGGGSIVPGVGFALATRLALQPNRLESKAYGAFDRPPLVSASVLMTLIGSAFRAMCKD